MTTDIKAIGERIKGLRDALDLTPDEMAQQLELETGAYLAYEQGEGDISISLLKRIEKEFNVDLATLMFGTEPKMSSYFVTRKDQGLAVERVAAYKYQSLTAGFTQDLPTTSPIFSL
jgi:transcriptional regulator with XRE-family HTH domain